MSLRLTVSNISKNYNGKPVLRDCSFSFDSSGIYVLMGPNGSGKSTFLRICALLECPDSGEVNFSSGSNIVRKDTELRRRISLVLPKIGLFNTTVFKNVAYGLKIRGMKKKEIEERVDKALELVGLIHKKNHTALTLSSGETQRLGIARAMVIEPEILFLDEPTASLDPHSTTIIEEAITKLKGNNRLTIIMVTHNIFQAQRLADMVLFMYDGRIVDHGPNKEFFEKPKDERAYRFITGQMVY
ncbi:MAG: ABC transporter ATP-binding protein [Nitrospirae bacterium CG_4_10_14_0_8_um_filter_41_23]|nr:phosphate ABC transporter ATP-binding protein [Nitrospirota bacterium]PIQ93047.1 MAG: ABC transporter ATP-binding protein [Nitrospirae bacterium CG11_big_fil_rev_8_21_14_0_20_41_14]PIV43971.1 MAG: ABC transporter ATP-binding protein [Nitrospirae bacterium CG02_land_8_20_14_3_00_41_53]PIW86716.1 MAG: ABC transporter ATP-binding protein [Nitrospirae bacterium CG_4_8_14_3_um_filter_41_47]PIY86763.1 MAG: ABC transporter ATP-binding protein [Nitrospirae bacterium CG_4_10_14_0_8_um_filter_41_23]P